ncbi:MAG: M20/M25/M40 family metallo-hydrolase [Acidimicrobiales bacterium]|nr:M20/M25/M40 family metallo-hydrolase [Acidimicrobiales bacterium]
MPLRRFVSRLALLLALAMAAGACTHVHVLVLAGESFGGRVPGTAGHDNAANYIIQYLRAHGVEAMDGTTNVASYEDAFASGTNIIGRVPGATTPDEYVIVGAHYDHLASCDNTGGTATCNGATDNAAGVAIVLEIAAAIFDDGPAPERTVIFALWDREEAGLLGSNAWVATNATLLEDAVAYVNYDIQGANLLRSLRNDTLAVGAETGGAALTGAVTAAGAGSTLDLFQLSLIFGLGRSDHANFAAADVPTVFFTDATGSCYHTTEDTYDVLDQGKLQEQRDIGVALVNELAAGVTTPTFTAAPAGTFADAVVIKTLVDAGLADLGLFSASDQATLTSISADIDAIVAAGAGAFDAAALNSLFTNSLSLVNLLEDGTDCDGFLTP